MSVLQRIVWSEGMLMSPQHFQQQDLYHEAVVHERLAAAAPYAWGLCALELDERALDESKVVVRALAGVLPGGTALRFRAGEPEAPAARAIESHHLPAHKERLDVHLALPLERASGSSYARGELERGRARYIVDTRSVLDAVSPDPQEARPVDFARRSPVLLLGDEAGEDYESIKLAELVRDRSGKLGFSPSYLPPCLRIGAAHALSDGLKRVLLAAVAKRRAVAQELRHRDGSTVEFAADEVTRYLAFHALSGAIPLLRHLLDDVSASPYLAYLLLTQFAGQLCAFSVDEDPALLPSYSHLDGRSTFEPLLAKLESLLQVAVASRVITVALESRVDGMHLGRLQAPELLQSETRFVLGVQTSVPEHTSYELLPRVAKIAAWTEIPRYLNAAVSTVVLSAATRPPREIPVRPGRQYFLVQTEGPVWRALVDERTIALHLPPPFEPSSTSVELLAIPRG
jgi:type VI secretion system protein ImpJ